MLAHRRNPGSLVDALVIMIALSLLSNRGIYQYVGTDVKKIANDDEMSKITVVYEWMLAQVTSSPMPPSLLEYALASCLAIGASTTGVYTSTDD